MLTRINTLAVGAVLALGILAAVPTARAANENIGEDSHSWVGPFGQCYVPSDCGGRRYSSRYRSGRYGYAYVPGWRYRPRAWHYER
jgi:hypothetical protein